MEKNRVILIHQHSRKCGGMGDLIRSCMTFYAVSKKNGFDFTIHLGLNPYLELCFAPFPTFNINNEQKTFDIKYEQVCLLEGDYSQPPEKTNQLLNQITEWQSFSLQAENKIRIILIQSNAMGFWPVEEIAQWKQDFFNQFFKPSDLVASKIAEIRSKYNIVEKDYLSIHVRCGDLVIQKEQTEEQLAQNPFRHVLTESTDYRLLGDDISSIINHLMENIVKQINQSKTEIKQVIIHSDSKEMRSLLAQIASKTMTDITFITLDDVAVAHVAEFIGEVSGQGFASTVAEFFIMSDAQMILSPTGNTISQFSLLASCAKNRPIMICESQKENPVLKLLPIHFVCTI